MSTILVKMGQQCEMMTCFLALGPDDDEVRNGLKTLVGLWVGLWVD